ncbi:PAS domain-containing protein [uncultured Bradyrhizobium sp.]|uniref:PAS domain-containing protein n=1 Tax=uncultured Bradyrhizobium sp. TaxID=199684 RepID=UPI002622F092|nr:PAS domain-containing protein [uncultured Bradyrhizobium sp.]
MASALHFESTNSTVVKSIRQRDFLNTWLRLYARTQTIPRIDEFRPARIEEDLPDTVFFTVDATAQPPRLTIESDGTRMATAYGHSGKGRLLDDYLGARLAPVVMPVYHECVARRLPAYTIADIDDIYGHVVAYERLLLPFSDGGPVTHLIASLKTISENGSFEIRNLMRGNDVPPNFKLCAIVDRDLFHRAPGRIPLGDVLEFG